MYVQCSDPFLRVIIFYRFLKFIRLNLDIYHSGRAVWGVGLGRLVAGIMGSIPAQGMDVCPLSFFVVLSCVVRDLATGLSLVQGVLPYI
jgi:hypothetical protein